MRPRGSLRHQARPWRAMRAALTVKFTAPKRSSRWNVSPFSGSVSDTPEFSIVARIYCLLKAELAILFSAATPARIGDAKLLPLRHAYVDVHSHSRDTPD